MKKIKNYIVNKLNGGSNIYTTYPQTKITETLTMHLKKLKLMKQFSQQQTEELSEIFKEMDDFDKILFHHDNKTLKSSLFNFTSIFPQIKSYGRESTDELKKIIGEFSDSVVQSAPENYKEKLLKLKLINQNFKKIINDLRKKEKKIKNKIRKKKGKLNKKRWTTLSTQMEKKFFVEIIPKKRCKIIEGIEKNALIERQRDLSKIHSELKFTDDEEFYNPQFLNIEIREPSTSDVNQLLNFIGGGNIAKAIQNEIHMPRDISWDNVTIFLTQFKLGSITGKKYIMARLYIENPRLYEFISRLKNKRISWLIVNKLVIPYYRSIKLSAIRKPHKSKKDVMVDNPDNHNLSWTKLNTNPEFIKIKTTVEAFLTLANAFPNLLIFLQKNKKWTDIEKIVVAKTDIEAFIQLIKTYPNLLKFIRKEPTLAIIKVISSKQENIKEHAKLVASVTNKELLEKLNIKKLEDFDLIPWYKFFSLHIELIEWIDIIDNVKNVTYKNYIIANVLKLWTDYKDGIWSLIYLFSVYTKTKNLIKELATKEAIYKNDLDKYLMLPYLYLELIAKKTRLIFLNYVLENEYLTLGDILYFFTKRRVVKKQQFDEKYVQQLAIQIKTGKIISIPARLGLDKLSKIVLTEKNIIKLNRYFLDYNTIFNYKNYISNLKKIFYNNPYYKYLHSDIVINAESAEKVEQLMSVENISKTFNTKYSRFFLHTNPEGKLDLNVQKGLSPEVNNKLEITQYNHLIEQLSKIALNKDDTLTLLNYYLLNPELKGGAESKESNESQNIITISQLNIAFAKINKLIPDGLKKLSKIFKKEKFVETDFENVELIKILIVYFRKYRNYTDSTLDLVKQLLKDKYVTDRTSYIKVMGQIILLDTEIINKQETILDLAQLYNVFLIFKEFEQQDPGIFEASKIAAKIPTKTGNFDFESLLNFINGSTIIQSDTGLETALETARNFKKNTLSSMKFILKLKNKQEVVAEIDKTSPEILWNMYITEIIILYKYITQYLSISKSILLLIQKYNLYFIFSQNSKYFLELCKSTGYKFHNYISRGVIKYYLNILNNIIFSLEIGRNLTKPVNIYFMINHYSTIKILQGFMESLYENWKAFDGTEGDEEERKNKSQLNVLEFIKKSENIRISFSLFYCMRHILDNYYNTQVSPVAVYLRINDWLLKPDEETNPVFQKANAKQLEVTDLNKCTTGSNQELISNMNFNEIFDNKGFSENETLALYMGLPTFLANGRNIMLLTYGYSGTGKSFTIFGAPGKPGILQKTLLDIDSNRIRYRYYEIYGLASNYKSYWSRDVKDYNHNIYYYDQQFLDKSKDNQPKEFPSVQFDEFIIDREKYWTEIKSTAIENFTNGVIQVIDKYRTSVKRIKKTKNNDKSSRSIAIIDFLVTSKSGIETLFTIIDLPGKEDLKTTYVDDNDIYKLDASITSKYDAEIIKSMMYLNPLWLMVIPEFSIALQEFVIKEGIDTISHQVFSKNMTTSKGVTTLSTKYTNFKAVKWINFNLKRGTLFTSKDHTNYRTVLKGIEIMQFLIQDNQFENIGKWYDEYFFKNPDIGLGISGFEGIYINENILGILSKLTNSKLKTKEQVVEVQKPVYTNGFQIGLQKFTTTSTPFIDYELTGLNYFLRDLVREPFNSYHVVKNIQKFLTDIKDDTTQYTYGNDTKSLKKWLQETYDFNKIFQENPKEPIGQILESYFDKIENYFLFFVVSNKDKVNKCSNQLDLLFRANKFIKAIYNYEK